MKKIAVLYYMMFFALFEFYSWENTREDPDDEAKYSTWAIMSVVFTSLVILFEASAYKYFSLEFILYSNFQVPAMVRFGWSLPLVLIFNAYWLLKNNDGFRFVSEFRKRPKAVRVAVRAIGLAVAVAICVGSFVATNDANLVSNSH